VALIAIFACELVYLRDSYGEKLYRMNTVFKLYFQAWTALAIAAPWCAYRILTAEAAPGSLRAAHSRAAWRSCWQRPPPTRSV
jgi:uncharacterized membrane protein